MQIGGVMLFVADLAAMETFYREAFGLTANEATRRDDWVEFETGAARLSLHQIPRESGVQPSAAPREMASCKPILAIEDLAAARDRLTAAGATILDRPWGGWDFADPEGNVLGVALRE